MGPVLMAILEAEGERVRAMKEKRLLRHTLGRGKLVTVGGFRAFARSQDVVFALLVEAQLHIAASDASLRMSEVLTN